LYIFPDTYKLTVVQGKTYMLRIINAALNYQLFFSIANHKMKVVAIDASYTEPYITDVIVLAPGHTTDVLLTADQPVGSYYMAARPYITVPAIADNTPTTGIIAYQHSTSATPPNAGPTGIQRHGQGPQVLHQSCWSCWWAPVGPSAT